MRNTKNKYERPDNPVVIFRVARETADRVDALIPKYRDPTALKPLTRNELVRRLFIERLAEA